MLVLVKSVEHDGTEYKVEFNGSNTWFVSKGGMTFKSTDTEKKAINALNKELKFSGYKPQ